MKSRVTITLTKEVDERQEKDLDRILNNKELTDTIKSFYKEAMEEFAAPNEKINVDVQFDKINN